MPFTPQISRYSGRPSPTLVSPSISTVSVGGSSEALNDVCWGQGKFVAVGEQAAAGSMIMVSSVDGETWVDRSNASIDGDAKAVIYDPQGDIFLAVGDNAGGGSDMVWTSTDGATWTGLGNVLLGILSVIGRGALDTDGNGLFVAGDAFARLSWSDDAGATWSADVAPSGLGSVQNITYCNGRWFACGAGAYAYSDDGKAWTLVTSALSIRRIVSHPGGYLLGSGGYVLYRSDDNGLTWAEVGRVLTNSPSNALVVGEGMIWIPQQSASSPNYVSPDGAGDAILGGNVDTWVNAGNTPLSTDVIHRAAYSPTHRRFVGVGYGASDVYVARVDLTWNE